MGLYTAKGCVKNPIFTLLIAFFQESFLQAEKGTFLKTITLRFG